MVVKNLPKSREKNKTKTHLLMRAQLALLVLLRAAATEAALGKKTTCGVVNCSIVCPGKLNCDPRGVERVAATTRKTERGRRCRRCCVNRRQTRISYPPRHRAAGGTASDRRRACRASRCEHRDRDKEKEEEKRERTERRVVVSYISSLSWKNEVEG